MFFSYPLLSLELIVLLSKHEVIRNLLGIYWCHFLWWLVVLFWCSKKWLLGWSLLLLQDFFGKRFGHLVIFYWRDVVYFFFWPYFRGWLPDFLLGATIGWILSPESGILEQWLSLIFSHGSCWSWSNLSKFIIFGILWWSFVLEFLAWPMLCLLCIFKILDTRWSILKWLKLFWGSLQLRWDSIGRIHEFLAPIGDYRGRLRHNPAIVLVFSKHFVHFRSSNQFLVINFVDEIFVILHVYKFPSTLISCLAAIYYGFWIVWADWWSNSDFRSWVSSRLELLFRRFFFRSPMTKNNVSIAVIDFSQRACLEDT